jgi:membrane associated rhomboid family serine protease
MKNDAVSEPAIRLPPVVKALCITLFGMTVLQHFVSAAVEQDIVLNFSVIPGRYTGVIPFSWTAVVAPVTHMFLHGGWLHMAVNVGMLMAFGTALEKAAGGRKFMLLYILSGILGAAVHVLIMPHDLSPLIGASGAISGLFGAVVMLMHQQGHFGGPGYARLVPLMLVWIGVSIFFGIFGMPGEEAKIAWIVHVAGFIAGLFMLKPILALKSI